MVSAVSFFANGETEAWEERECVCLSGVFALGLDPPHQACLGHLQGQQVGEGEALAAGRSKY